MKHIASCSFGKDSLAMVLMLIEKSYPLDEVVFYDTGMEFQAIYNVRDKLRLVLEDHGIKYVELRPENPFEYDMCERPVDGWKKGFHYGYGWCGGCNRWGTTRKLVALDKYAEENEAIVYIAIAYDEQARLEKEIKPYKQHPLVDWQMTEQDCLEYCYANGFDWDENGVDLYSILDRVSCWCCCNKNRKELKNIYLYLPEYWERLKALQARLDRPMKSFQSKEYGNYGNVFDMEKVFALEENERGDQVGLWDDF